MTTRIFRICNSYESGYGHGFAMDGLDLSKTPHSDPELGEAYQIGYGAGIRNRSIQASIKRKIPVVWSDALPRNKKELMDNNYYISEFMCSFDKEGNTE